MPESSQHPPEVPAAIPAAAQFETHGQLTKGLPVLVQEATQLERGGAVFITRQVCGRDLVLSELRFAPRLTGHIVLEPEWCAFFAPLGWHGDFLFNGREARRNNLFLSAGPDGYATLGRKRHTLVLGLRKAPLRDACAALTGAPIDVAVLSDRTLTLDSVTGRAFRHGVTQAILTSGDHPLPDGRYALAATVERRLIDLCALLLLEQGALVEVRGSGRIEPISIVREAKAIIDTGGVGSVTLSDLCSAGGVGVASLHRCFVEIHGVSPMRYLRAHRLSLARDRLLDPIDPPRSVKDVSLSLGFLNGGRFAASYAARFGEMPATTLARNPSSGRAT